MFAIALPPARAGLRAPGLGVLSVALIVAFAVLQQALVTPLDADVSWLLTVGERVLDGARLYRDIFEVNPPASVFLYLPGITLARTLGLPPEAVTVALVFAVGLVSAWASARLIEERSPWLAAMAAFALFVLPASCFAQREHWALLFALPAIAAIARAADGGDAPWWSGVGAGLTMAVKPHFALALLPLAWLAWRRRGSLRPIAGGLIAAGVVVGGYALSVAVLYPVYLTDALPLLRATYLPLHERWDRLLLGPVVSMPVALGALTIWLGVSDTRARFCLLAMTGFAVAGLIQAKGYPNHAIPGAALGLLAVAFAARNADAAKRHMALAGALTLALLQWHNFATVGPRPGLADAIKTVAPPRPRIAALSIDLDIGHPAVRAVEGRWVGSRAAQFVWGGVAWRGDPNLRPYAAADVAIWAADVARERPDAILVDESAGSAGLRREPAVCRALIPYRPAARAGEVAVWIRRSGASTPPHIPACPA